MALDRERETDEPAGSVPDPVEEADQESFPASDAPARTVVTGIPDAPLDEDTEGH